MKQLTDAEVEKFASAKGAKRVAVENFLMTLDTDIGSLGNMLNLHQDAQSYKWNTATVRAIEAGIRFAERKR